MHPDTVFLIAIIGAGLVTLLWVAEVIYAIYSNYREKYQADLVAEKWFRMLEKRRWK